MYKYIKDSAATFGTQLLSLFLILCTHVIIARALGPEGKGIVTLLSLFPFLVAMVVSLGIDESNIYFLGNKEALHNRVISNSICLTLIMTLFSIVLLMFFKEQIISHFLKSVKVNYFLLSIWSIPFFLFLRYGEAILKGHKAFFKYNFIWIMRQVLNVFLCILLLYILKLGVLGGVLTIPFTTGVISFLTLFYLWRIGVPSLPDFRLFKKSFAYGAKSQPGILASFLNKRLDMFIINFFLNPLAVGYYSIAVAIAEIIWYLPNSLAITLFPEVASSGKQRADTLTSQVMRNLLFIMVIIAILLAAVGKPLILIAFGTAFSSAIVPFWILLPGVIAIGITKIVGSNLSGRGKPEYGTYLAIISCAFTIGLDLLLIPRFGINGAAVASTTAYSISTFVGISLFLKESHLSLESILIPKTNEIRNYLTLTKGIFQKYE